MALIDNSDPYYRLQGMIFGASTHKSDAYSPSTLLPSMASASASDTIGLAPIASQMDVMRASPLQSSAASPTPRGFSVRASQLGSRIAGATLPGTSAGSMSTNCLLAVPASAIPSVLSSCR
ncbi:hypothetical protein [Paraburkholderia hospita]|uniref:hypothetical protein n=1 Tax=Paraburkholderia hospita TaxID=169430 RepID=UPI000DEEBDD2|nr:hypothetical protein [Paraburkholderia hospita]AXF05529.1 hypothetical protein CUJ88_44350 [Paraburkholderia hospita]